MLFLGIDVGSTWLKSALLDTGRNRVEEALRLPAPGFAGADRNGGLMPAGGREIPLEALAESVRALIEKASERHGLSGVLFSVQMHGFALWNKNGVPVTHYVTWQDMRGTLGERTVLSRLREDGYEQLFLENGMVLQPNHSVVPLLHLAQAQGVEAGTQFSMLGDALVRLLAGRRAAIHVTNAASSGLHSLMKKDWNRELIRRLGLEGLDFPPVTEKVEPAAVYEWAGGRIPLYTAVGDQQASVRGMGAKTGDAFLNIATGGQIGIVTGEVLPGDWETRPYFGGACLRTYTQMPAGRRLQELHDDLLRTGKDIFGEDASEKLWAFMGAPEAAGCPGGLPEEKAPGWSAAAKRQIRECYAEMAAAYGQALKALDPEGRLRGRILAGGGALLRNPALFACLQEALPRPLVPAPVEADSMAGLLRVAEEISP